jgi:chromosome partitioning protein
MILLVAAEKGGVGKSTIATNLSVHLAQCGVDVVLLDTDRLPPPDSSSGATKSA